MRLTKITAESFQGASFEFDLKPITVFTGANDSGKTRVLNAIKYSLLDYIPRLGKQPARLQKLMSPNAMQTTVTLELNDADINASTTVQRGLKRKANGDIGRANGKEPLWEVPSVMFDFSEYLGKTQKEQIAMIFERIGKSDLQFDEQSFLSKLLAIEVLPSSECKKAIENLQKFLTASQKRRSSAKQSIQDWLTSLVKEFDDEKKRYNTLANTLSGQMIGHRQSGPAPKSVADQIAKLVQQIEETKKTVSDLQSRQKSIANTSQRRAELEAIIAKPIPEVSEKQMIADSLRAEIKDYVSQLQSIQAKIKSKIEETNKKKTEHNELYIESAAIQKRLEELEDHCKCPFCKSNRQGWKIEYAKELAEKAESIVKHSTAVFAEIETLVKQGKALREKEDQAKKDDQDIATKHQTLSKLEADIAAAKEAETNRKNAQAELSGLTAAVEPIDAAELDKLVVKLNQLTDEKNKLDEQETSFKNFQQISEKFKQTEKDLLTNQTHAAVFKEASALVVSEQETIMNSAFKPLIERARKFTDGIITARIDGQWLPGTLDYRDGELGIETSAGWISHEVMATMSQTLAYIGIAIALAQSSPVKIVILDEAGIIDAKRKPLMIFRMLELIKDGVIDSVVMADPGTNGYEVVHKDFALIPVCE